MTLSIEQMADALWRAEQTATPVQPLREAITAAAAAGGTTILGVAASAVVADSAVAEGLTGTV